MTLFTSGTDTMSRKAGHTCFAYLLVSIFVALFGGIYEIFSHGVYSGYMIYAFAFPLVGGALPFLTCCLSQRFPHPGALVRNLYHSGIATLTTGSIVRGILEIYGTTNSLSGLYWVLGIALLLFAASLICVQIFLRKSV